MFLSVQDAGRSGLGVVKHSSALGVSANMHWVGFVSTVNVLQSCQSECPVKYSAAMTVDAWFWNCSRSTMSSPHFGLKLLRHLNAERLVTQP